MKTTVNLITLSRLLGVILLPFIYGNINQNYLVVYIIILLATDFLDGFLARKFNVSTLFGSLFDVLADKVLSLLLLSLILKEHKIITSLLIIEVIITLINIVGALIGSNVSSSKLGKTKTFILSFILFVALIDIFNIHFSFLTIFYNNSVVIINTLTTIGLIMGLIVAVDYIHTHVNYENKININKYRWKKKDELTHALFNTNYFHETIDKPILLKLGVLK